MKVYLVDATYELFRAYYGAPGRTAPDGREVGAVYGLMASLLPWLAKLRGEALGFATDHVIESFRNTLWPGYKSSAGIPQELVDQIPLAEQALRALGMVVWPMVEFEADDAMATAAARFQALADQVYLVSPDKDFAQCVQGNHVVVLDRHRQRVLDEPGVLARFGVGPRSVPDWLALVGDAADGIPGIPGWGGRSAATVLRRFFHIEQIPLDAASWNFPLRNKERLAESLRTHWNEALLFKTLTTLRLDVPLPQQYLQDLVWPGPAWDGLSSFCARWGFEKLLARAEALFGR
ncbi:MAG: hypothetical protein KatS3mg077_1402 [Candidatus Binatia bacterium]|nr:MAG: hypothetical protein KatS3mg077_1402 [Candidatus Binatia bacterium]